MNTAVGMASFVEASASSAVKGAAMFAAQASSSTERRHERRSHFAFHTTGYGVSRRSV